MRIVVLAAGIALAAGAALAQLTTGQPPVETGASGQEQPDTVAQPRFIPAPGTNGIEVAPLPPPGTDGAAPADLPPGGGAVAATPRPAEGELVPQGTTRPPQGTTVPPQGPADVIALQDPDGADLLLEQGAGLDGLASPAGTDAPVRQRRFKAAPESGGPALGPTGPAVPIDAVPTELRRGVRLRELDKMTGQTETFEIAVGDTRQVDRLKIRLEACRSPETNDTHGTMAFLKIWDVREPEDEAFSGWMFAESPSLSALDHPRYDVWVISCTVASVAASTPPIQ